MFGGVCGFREVETEKPQTATSAFAAAALPYVQTLAELGVVAAARRDAGLAAAVQIVAGAVTSASLARDTGKNYQQLL